MAYRVLSNLKRNGIRYEKGAIAELGLTEEEAQKLIDGGTIELFDGEVTETTPDEDVTVDETEDPKVPDPLASDELDEPVSGQPTPEEVTATADLAGSPTLPQDGSVVDIG